MKKSFTVLLTLLLVLTVLVSGCGANKTPAQNAEAPKELKKFNVGYLPSTGHILYFIAQEKGYFKEEGLDVELFQFTNSGEGLNAIVAGKLDAGSFGTAPPLTFISKGTDLTIFGGQMTEGHAIIAKPENAAQFKDLTNFKGKTVATVRLSTGDIVFRGGFTQAGIDWQKDITIQELESPAAVLEAVKKGSADAGIVWTPYRQLALQQGLAIVKYSGEVAPNHPCCRQVALTEKIQANPEDYEKFSAALIKAYRFYQTSHGESLDILAKYVNVDKDVLEAETYGGHISSNPDPNKKEGEDFWNFMKQIGYITSDENIDNHINTAIYKNALESVLKRYPNDETYKKLKADFKE
ncbi:ABC transporter substrate-binding protein [Bacillota bacterium LX-D]|nr:ABC transporter substrate-binding protein [Bacillota bacterium LX-D]